MRCPFILQNNKKAKKLLEKLPTIYAVVAGVRYGTYAVQEYKFVKWDKNNRPLVYNYEDFNGERDQWVIRDISYPTNGRTVIWSFDASIADHIAEKLAFGNAYAIEQLKKLDEPATNKDWLDRWTIII